MSSLRPDKQRLAARFQGPVVTRFAPSPTGYLHLGHVVNAIYVWGIARALGGRVRLRVEDHDRIRSRPPFEAALLEDLDWLGFVPDAGRDPLCRQSDAPETYARALEALRRTEHVYVCACSRKEIGGERYMGACRARGLEDGPGRSVRVSLERSVERFDDGLLGTLEQVPAHQCGDLLLRDRDGHWTYQFAVTVDDALQGITLVIRGVDLVGSSGRQIALARMLGRRDPPVFLHHPLVIRPDGRKLSKSSRDTGVRDLRDAGWHADDVIGHAAAAVGLIPAPRPVTARDVAALFT